MKRSRDERPLARRHTRPNARRPERNLALDSKLNVVLTINRCAKSTKKTAPNLEDFSPLLYKQLKHIKIAQRCQAVVFLYDLPNHITPLPKESHLYSLFCLQLQQASCPTFVGVEDNQELAGSDTLYFDGSYWKLHVRFGSMPNRGIVK